MNLLFILGVILIILSIMYHCILVKEIKDSDTRFNFHISLIVLLVAVSVCLIFYRKNTTFKSSNYDVEKIAEKYNARIVEIQTDDISKNNESYIVQTKYLMNEDEWTYYKYKYIPDELDTYKKGND